MLEVEAIRRRGENGWPYHFAASGAIPCYSRISTHCLCSSIAFTEHSVVQVLQSV